MAELDLEALVSDMENKILSLGDALEILNDELTQKGEALEQLSQEIIRAELRLREVNDQFHMDPVMMTGDNSHPSECNCVECKKERKRAKNREYRIKNKDRIAERAKKLREIKQAKLINAQKLAGIGLNRGDDSIDKFVAILTGFAQEAEKCVGDPIRFRALQEATRISVTEMSQKSDETSPKI